MRSKKSKDKREHAKQWAIDHQLCPLTNRCEPGICKDCPYTTSLNSDSCPIEKKDEIEVL